MAFRRLNYLSIKGYVTYDNRSAGGYGYGYNAANRMASFALNGVVQAEYVYNAFGQQVIRRLPQTGAVIHAVHDADGNRIAEYAYDTLAGTSALLREYIWMDGEAVAVVENDTVYYIRTDHIGRPVFATDGAGAQVWTASYLPFGRVYASSGPNSDLRFPPLGHLSDALPGNGTNGSRPRAACTKTGCATTTRRWGVIFKAIRWGWWMAHPSMGMLSRTRGGI